MPRKGKSRELAANTLENKRYVSPFEYLPPTLGPPPAALVSALLVKPVKSVRFAPISSPVPCPLLFRPLSLNPPDGHDPLPLSSSLASDSQQAPARQTQRIQKKKTLHAETPIVPDLSEQTQSLPNARTGQSLNSCSGGISQPNPNKDSKRSKLYVKEKLETWLEDVRTIAVDPCETNSYRSVTDVSNIPTQTEYSPTTRRTSPILAWNPRTKKVTPEALRTRQVEVIEANEDEWTAEFREHLVEKRMKISFKKTEPLLQSMKNFERKTKLANDDDDSWDAIEELCKEINEWRAAMRLGAITSENFKNDLDYCKSSSNKVAFQRMVMMSIIDRCHLKPVFNYNFEGQWNQEICPLPSTNGLLDIIADPQPDLAIFFEFASLVGTDSFSKSAPIPPELQPCMNPDGNTQRCFPFIFIEAKKATADIESAILKNLHSASQALFNIYAWMSRAKQDDVFFKDVRVFSVAINEEEAIVRVHWAVPVSNGDDSGLEFLHNNLHYRQEKKPYTRDGLCTLIHNILINYAEKTLLKILKSTVDKILKEHKKTLKRKNNNALLGPSPKRLAFSQ
ncbi:hypothetical protein F5B22DRAFT_650748 [Xylaria bambusicola]|uniref:uncharacterized protein n=1 Tax=Xylaria bambusicola TaxID=326684 RepID=UPI0020084ED9|nr:uncharacterized protein F5B22DRAFT_650748 [Xylaria bambusicola]KAI0506358.1 hypothetical protein F5B22DRAFT_650748 [Xylaria bambusicola]